MLSAEEPRAPSSPEMPPSAGFSLLAIACSAPQPSPYPNLDPYIERLVRAFGARRCFWGTDLSRMIGAHGIGYKEAIAHFQGVPFLSEADKESIMGRGLCEWLRWPA